ncbi:putative methionyl-tRNA synthetase [Hordeum vulgare]|nr:putative methionyl-tRNA synthetase [Hordeum vulgare]
MAFDERKLVDPDFVHIHMDCSEKAMLNHCSAIQTACNKWHGIVEEVAACPESGANVEGQMVRMFAMYRADNEDQEFKFLHVFSRIESFKKWREVRLALDKAKETYNPDARAPAVADGRPDGTKKARVASDATPAVERLQSSIEQCITDAKSSAAWREEKSNTRWSALMTNQHAKLDLHRTNIAIKKRNIDVAFLMRADTLTMDEQVKAWYLVERGLILNQMPTPAATTVATTTTTPTTTPNPSAEITPATSSTTPMTSSTPASPATEEPHYDEPTV